ncbi:MAG: hypothetical protein ABR561_06620 [Guyparkeria sp.]
MTLEVSLLTVFTAALITALTTGLGAIPVAFAKKVDARWLAVGAALAASHSLVAEGSAIGS